MSDLLLHAKTQARFEAFLEHPGHALLISGPAGSGKGSLARELSASLLDVKAVSLDKHPYIRHIGEDEDTITIEAVRGLGGFLSKKVPGDSWRVVIIENAEHMGHEAQNALLKTLEEPPTRTTLLLTSASTEALLPTVRSRAALLSVIRPSETQAEAYFVGQGFDEAAIRQARLMSGGLPGLMHALLSSDKSHPMFEAAAQARQLLQADVFQRLTQVDALAKDRELCVRVLAIMQEMAHVALAQGAPPARWKRILTESYEAQARLRGSAQPKLTLTNLMLNL